MFLAWDVGLSLLMIFLLAELWGNKKHHIARELVWVCGCVCMGVVYVGVSKCMCVSMECGYVSVGICVHAWVWCLFLPSFFFFKLVLFLLCFDYCFRGANSCTCAWRYLRSPEENIRSPEQWWLSPHILVLWTKLRLSLRTTSLSLSPSQRSCFWDRISLGSFYLACSLCELGW